MFLMFFPLLSSDDIKHRKECDPKERIITEIFVAPFTLCANFHKHVVSLLGFHLLFFFISSFF